MKVLGRMTVFPIMPARISRLYELAYNLWWSWRPEARALYRTLDPDVWDHVGHNPVQFLSEVLPKRLEEAARRDDYLQAYDSVLRDFDYYMHAELGGYLVHTHLPGTDPAGHCVFLSRIWFA